VNRHVSVETLARRQEGVLSTRKAARIDAHMSLCARCADTKADLLGVRGLLAATSPVPMPDSIAQRIQMAIADESAARAARTAPLGSGAYAAMGVDTSGATAVGGDAASEAGERGVVIPGRPDLPTRARHSRTTRRFRLASLSSPLALRAMAATAAVVVIAGAGFLLANGQQQSHKAASGTAPSPSGAAKQRLRAVHTVAGSVSVPYRLQGKLVTTTALVSHTNFQRSSLARLARMDVRQSASLTKPSVGTATPVNGAGPLSGRAGLDVARLENCLSSIDAGRTVLVTEIARFLGKPATIIVLQSLRSADFLDIAIVGPACSASSAHLIYQTTIPAG
jgi:hypothetical protein